jgi:tRNA pseudouridine55 synthase
MTMPITPAGKAERESDLHAGAMLLVDKPKGWTSFDVVNRIRHLYRIRRVGHAGTLDPAATGLLILCTAGMTKSLDEFMGLEKEYEAEISLGARTPSYDGETPVVERKGTSDVTEERVRTVIAGFVGTQQQIPPMYSAAKVGGRRLYKYARQGIEVVRRPREVHIRSITIDRIEIPTVTMTVVCSKGTYIRSLANDIGDRLGCGAYLSALRRTRIGPYHVRDARSIPSLVASAGGRPGNA